MSANGLLYPLDMLYERAGVSPPKVRRLSPDQIPQPYRELLVHENSMTVTLERHVGGPLGVRTLSTRMRLASYYRRVLLVRVDSGQPVAMGAARVTLTAFTPRVRARILENKVPLGRILKDQHVAYISRPQAFLGITPNAEMMGVFWMREPQLLFGRRTDMIHEGHKIGDIVEILRHF
jgi:chorismate-pyruvate lyase